MALRTEDGLYKIFEVFTLHGLDALAVFKLEYDPAFFSVHTSFCASVDHEDGSNQFI